MVPFDLGIKRYAEFIYILTIFFSIYKYLSYIAGEKTSTKYLQSVLLSNFVLNKSAEKDTNEENILRYDGKQYYG